MYAYGTQQTPATIAQNVARSIALHSVSREQGEANRRVYEAEKTRRYKLRLLDAWRARELDARLTFFPDASGM